MESRIQHILLNAPTRLWLALITLAVLAAAPQTTMAANPDEIELEPLVVREPVVRHRDRYAVDDALNILIEVGA